MTETPNNNLDFLKFVPRFKSLDTEREFRESFLPQDKSFAKLIILGTLLIALVSTVPDTLSGTAAETLRVLYLTTFIYCVFSLIILKSLSLISGYRKFDLIMTLWWLSVISVSTISVSLYPADMTIHVVFDILFPVAIYLLIPIGLVAQFSLATLFTVANLVILLTVKESLTQTDLAFIYTAYAATHLLGIITCWQTHAGRRKQFIEKKAEQTLKKELQETFDELRILRGIIPICSYCKQIRDDEGFWHQVEKYVRNHSEAEFTHGVCPDCIQKNFPEEHRIIMKDTQNQH